MVVFIVSSVAELVVMGLLVVVEVVMVETLVWLSGVVNLMWSLEVVLVVMVLLIVDFGN